MKNEIKNPEQKTYYICREDANFTITAYGSVEPTQVMQTGQPIMDTYTKEMEWINELLDNGINPLPDTVEEVQ